MDIRQTQTLQQQLSHRQLQGVHILQLNTYELAAHIRDLALENPLIEPQELPLSPPTELPSVRTERQDWLDESDWQNRSYPSADRETDPLFFAADDGGLAETLRSFLTRQLPTRSTDSALYDAAVYLIDCLEDDGYLRVPIDELAESSRFSPELLRRAHELIRSLEPSGVGAVDLGDCLCLQLKRIGRGGIAAEIAARHLEAFARGNLRAIAKSLGVSVAEVERAGAVIRSLDPRPGAVFQPPQQQVQFVRPDVIVEEADGVLRARLLHGEQKLFTLNAAYLEMLRSTDDAEVKHYLSEKLRQARELQDGIDQRRTTLLRCTDAILARQERFFREGGALAPLRLQEVAQSLSLHVSTVSRALSGKYLQCSFGLFPFKYFFPGSASAGADVPVSSAGAKALLQQFIRDEDAAKPLSDQKLCELLAAHGCAISRRTVAKYRDELGIPSTSRRAHRAE